MTPFTTLEITPDVMPEPDDVIHDAPPLPPDVYGGTTAADMIAASNGPSTYPVPSIASKPAGGVFVGAATALVLSIVDRYTGYHPTTEEATLIPVIVGGLAMWLIPEEIRRKLDG